VLVAHPLLLVTLRDLADRTRPPGAFAGFVTSGSAILVSSVCQGSAVSQEGHVPRAASAGAPQAGHLRAEFTGGF